MAVTGTVVGGRHQQATLTAFVGAALGGVTLLTVGLLAPGVVVYWGFELTVAGTVIGGLVGLLAARAGSSLAAAVLLVFVPGAVVTLGSPGSLTFERPVVTLGTVLYVAGGAAIPVGMLAYAAGVRWRTGRWESSLRGHLGNGTGLVLVGIGWVLAASAVVYGSLIFPWMNLGVVQFGLLVGGLLVAAGVGVRRAGVETATVVGMVGAALVALTWGLGITPGIAPSLGTLGFVVGAAVVVGVPVGIVGYVAGRALRADATD